MLMLLKMVTITCNLWDVFYHLRCLDIEQTKDTLRIIAAENQC